MQNFAEIIHPESSEEILAVFIFDEFVMPPLPVDGHAPHTHWRNDTERQSKEASLCNNVLVFFLCGGLCNYQSIKTAAMGRKLDQKDSALLVSTSTTSEHLALTGSLVFYIYSSKLILLYSDQGRQTIENQLLHSLYQCMHIITSPISIFVHFFRSFTFTEAGLSAKIVKICTQHKFPTIR